MSRRAQGFGRCGAVTPALSGSAPILQVEAVEIGQREIENEATRRSDATPTRQKLLSNDENLDLPTGEADQRLERTLQHIRKATGGKADEAPTVKQVRV